MNNVIAGFEEFEVVGDHSKNLLISGKLNHKIHDTTEKKQPKLYKSKPTKSDLIQSSSSLSSSSSSMLDNKHKFEFKKYEEMSQTIGNGLYQPSYFREREILAPYRKKYGCVWNDDHSQDCGHCYTAPANSPQHKELQALHDNGYSYLSAPTSNSGCLICQRFQEDSKLYRGHVDVLRKLLWIRQAAEYYSSFRDFDLDNIDFLCRIEIQTTKWLAKDLDVPHSYIVRAPKKH